MDSDKILVADVYDPMHLEQLEQAKDLGVDGRALALRETTRILNDQLRRADFALCASEKQRDFWLGQLAGQGRVNASVYDNDRSSTIASLTSRIDRSRSSSGYFLGAGMTPPFRGIRPCTRPGATHTAARWALA